MPLIILSSHFSLKNIAGNSNLLDVIVSEVTTSSGCYGVRLSWSSSTTNEYRLRVLCGNNFFSFTTPYANVTLKLADYENISVCNVFISALTPVGWGPEAETTVTFYEGKL